MEQLKLTFADLSSVPRVLQGVFRLVEPAEASQDPQKHSADRQRGQQRPGFVDNGRTAHHLRHHTGRRAVTAAHQHAGRICGSFRSFGVRFRHAAGGQ